MWCSQKEWVGILRETPKSRQLVLTFYDKIDVQWLRLSLQVFAGSVFLSVWALWNLVRNPVSLVRAERPYSTYSAGPRPSRIEFHRCSGRQVQCVYLVAASRCVCVCRTCSLFDFCWYAVHKLRAAACVVAKVPSIVHKTTQVVTGVSAYCDSGFFLKFENHTLVLESL